VIAAQYSPAAAVPGDAALGDDGVPRAGPLRAETCQLFETGCPIYLRTLSLRI
jgi:hypothetical protein